MPTDRFDRIILGTNLSGTNNADGSVTIDASGGGGSAHVIEDEATPLTQRAALNFEGAGVTVTDDAGNDATVVTIPGGGAGSSGALPLLTQIPNSFTTTSTTYVSQAGANVTVGDILGYRTLYDGGDRLEFRLKALLAPGSGTIFAQLEGGEYSDGDTAATSKFTVCEIQKATGSNAFKVSAWTEPTAWTPADDHLRVVAQVKVSGGTAGSFFQIFAEYRWV